MNKDRVLKTLTDLGLKKTEAKIYFYLAKKGPRKGQEIAKAIGITKQRLYLIIKNLQNKAIINSSLDRPAKFTAISFEKLLDLFAKAKLEEAKIIQKNKGKLLSDWQSIYAPITNDETPKFSVIKGRKNVFLKIKQMIEETKNLFSVISDVSDLLRTDQFGVWDSIENNQMVSKIKFRFITETSNESLNSIRILKELIPKLSLKVRNSTLGLSLFPKMVLKDEKELLYFISTRTNRLDNDYNCLFTDCKSLVNPFSKVFEDIWSNSTDIEQKIREIEAGILPQKTLIIRDIAEAQAIYNEVLKKTKKEILIVTSADKLGDFQKAIPKIKDQTNRNLSIKIMSPIIKENLEAANKLLEHSQVKHIPQGYLDTIIIDDNHLFQFNNSSSKVNDVEKKQIFKSAFYTDDPEYVIRTKNMLENIWRNSSNISRNSIESVFDPLNSFSLPPKSTSNCTSSEVLCDYLKSKPVVSRTIHGEVTEEEVIAKIIDLHQSEDSSSKVVKCYCKIGYAAINPPSQFDLPKMLIVITQIDKKSSFGAEDRLVFHIWQKTKEGFRYVPVAIIGDNPNFPVEILEKGQFNDTPAATNFQLVRREEIKFQLYGNTFLAHWTIPITLSKKITLPPGTVILEAYGEVKTKRVNLHYPTGARYDIFYNAFDSFVTYMHESSKYIGPGTDGLFLRDAFIEIFLP